MQSIVVPTPNTPKKDMHVARSWYRNPLTPRPLPFTSLLLPCRQIPPTRSVRGRVVNRIYQDLQKCTSSRSVYC